MGGGDGGTGAAEQNSRLFQFKTVNTKSFLLLHVLCQNIQNHKREIIFTDKYIKVYNLL
jgi:hypothetical protein